MKNCQQCKYHNDSICEAYKNERGVCVKQRDFANLMLKVALLFLTLVVATAMYFAK
jgi:hypothetical protein